MRVRLIIALMAACASSPLLAQASGPPAAATQLLPGNAAADIVRDVTEAVRKNYVHPDRIEAIGKRLAASLSSGRYATTNPAVLAERMSADLFESSGNDRHMYINYKPDEAAARAGPGGLQGGPNLSFFEQQMRATNHGITELRVLPGNVRYMNISQWFWNDASTPRVYDEAMRFMRDGDAMIIDISRNGGGSAEAVNYMVSHFMEPDQKLMTFKNGPTDVDVIRTKKIASGRITGKPLFVLTGPASGSASEEFAMHVRHFELGTLVGGTTGGAGNPNGLTPVAHGFVVSVSTGLAMHPVTNAGWEGVGVTPHRAVELSKAIDVAHLEALEASLASASPQSRPMLEWTIAALSSDGVATPPSPAQLRTFAGAYDGDRRITERAGRLYWKRGNGPELELVPLGGTRFAVGDKFGTRIEFGAGESGMEIHRPGIAPEHAARQTS